MEPSDLLSTYTVLISDDRKDRDLWLSRLKELCLLAPVYVCNNLSKSIQKFKSRVIKLIFIHLNFSIDINSLQLVSDPNRKLSGFMDKGQQELVQCYKFFLVIPKIIKSFTNEIVKQLNVMQISISQTYKYTLEYAILSGIFSRHLVIRKLDFG
ncbi:MAG TPA: hypothetical protein VK169_19595 [Saprospiraceae bacterium]|nr:hypothetical protein [Saprospiraceae bacterium]